MLRLKQLLKERGLTIKNLADMLGVTDGAVSQTINGNPTIGKLKEIADVLNVPITELLDVPNSEGLVTCPHCGKSIRVSLGCASDAALSES